MFKNSKKINGFTLIEIIVSIFIISLLSGLFLANYHSNNSRTQAQMSAQKLASDIRMVQSYALGVKEHNGVAPDMGWGVFLANNANDYVIFANNEGDYTRDSDGSEDISTKTLPKGITISSASTDVLFLPPDPTVYIDSATFSIADIILTDGEISKTVRVNFFGLVEVLN